MNNYIENRLKQLNVTKKTNAILLIIFGILLLSSGFSLIAYTVRRYIEEPDTEPAVIIVIIAVGIIIALSGIISGYFGFKRMKYKKLVETNPSHFVKSFGLKTDVKSAIKEFNESYANGEIIYEDKTVLISEKYILYDENFHLNLGDLSNLAYIHHEVLTVTIQNVRQTSWNYTFFFNSGESKAETFTIATTNGKSQQLEKLLTRLDFDINTDKKMARKALKNWNEFLTEIRK